MLVMNKHIHDDMLNMLENIKKKGCEALCFITVLSFVSH